MSRTTPRMGSSRAPPTAGMIVNTTPSAVHFHVDIVYQRTESDNLVVLSSGLFEDDDGM